MRGGAKDAFVSGVERLLQVRGYEGIDLELSRRDTVEWAKTRVQSIRTGRRVVGGSGLVISSPGRIELRPVERLLAGPGEVTVEVLTTAVSAGTERAEWLRLPNLQPPFPYTPGYSGAGRVIACGPGPHQVPPGTLVAVARLRHASVATVPAAYASAVPDGVSAEEAALVYLAIISGYGVQRAELPAGESICVVGAGPIGALAVRMAMLDDPGAVTVVAASSRREEGARRSGASDFRTIDGGVESVEAAVVIEATGDPDAIATAVAAARPGGTVVLLGSPWGVTHDVSIAAIQHKSLRVVGAHISSLATAAKRLEVDPFRELADRYLGAVAAGRITVDDLLGERVDPREIRLFYRRLSRGDVLTGHLDWRSLPRDERIRMPSLLSLPELPPRSPTVVGKPLGPVAPSRRRLRFAVVGCGDIGHRNARAIARAHNADLAVSFDAVPALADAAAAAFGGTTAATLDEALAPERVDAVFISLPHDLHTPIIARAAEAGLHVIIEKPLAHDLNAAREAIDIAELAGVTLSVCFPYRYEAPVVAARWLVQEGALDALRGAAVVFHDDQPDAYWRGGFSGRAVSDWRSQRARSGGGVLIMSLIHHIDILRHVLGAEIAMVTGASFTRPGEEVEDAVSLALRFEGGAVATLLGSTSTRGRPPVRMEMWGETGTIRLQPHPSAYSDRAVGGLVPGRWSRLPADDGSDLRAVFVERFAMSVASGRPPEVPASDGLAAQAVIEAGYRSIELGVPVSPSALIEESV
jgi:2-desacetyl-2-hydroxyethyl bacteriochlorophyllide A dehydrogenase